MYWSINPVKKKKKRLLEHIYGVRDRAVLFFFVAMSGIKAYLHIWVGDVSFFRGLIGMSSNYTAPLQYIKLRKQQGFSNHIQGNYLLPFPPQPPPPIPTKSSRTRSPPLPCASSIPTATSEPRKDRCWHIANGRKTNHWITKSLMRDGTTSLPPTPSPLLPSVPPVATLFTALASPTPLFSFLASNPFSSNLHILH